MKKSTLACAVAATLFGSGNSMAGGLWLNEFGDFSGGRSSAGASAGVDEAATIIHNPASASRIEGSQLFGAAGALIPDVKFDIDYTNPLNGNDNGGDAGLSAPVAGFRPRLCRFDLTQNLPKPLIMTSSPDSNVCLIVSNNISTVSVALFLDIGTFLHSESDIRAFVSVMVSMPPLCVRDSYCPFL